MMHAVHGKKSFKVFRRGQYLVCLFSVSLCKIYSCFLDEVTVISYNDDTAPYSDNKTNNLVIK